MAMIHTIATKKPMEVLATRAAGSFPLSAKIATNMAITRPERPAKSNMRGNLGEESVPEFSL
jgi:hypothetical protein